MGAGGDADGTPPPAVNPNYVAGGSAGDANASAAAAAPADAPASVQASAPPPEAGGSSEPPPARSDTWPCQACTLVNPQGLDACSVCATPKGGRAMAPGMAGSVADSVVAPPCAQTPPSGVYPPTVPQGPYPPTQQQQQQQQLLLLQQDPYPAYPPSSGATASSDPYPQYTQPPAPSTAYPYPQYTQPAAAAATAAAAQAASAYPPYSGTADASASSALGGYPPAQPPAAADPYPKYVPPQQQQPYPYPAAQPPPRHYDPHNASSVSVDMNASRAQVPAAYPPAAGGHGGHHGDVSAAARPQAASSGGNPYTAGFEGGTGGPVAPVPVPAGGMAPGVDAPAVYPAFGQNSAVPPHMQTAPGTAPGDSGGAPVVPGQITYRKCENYLAGSTMAVVGAYHKASLNTYCVRLKDVNEPQFLGHVEQGWNMKYSAAQKIFGGGMQSQVVRLGIKAQRASLYFGGSMTEKKGVLDSGRAMLDLIAQGRDAKNQVVFFTYVITLDGEWNFCHTGASTLRDMLSKHAMHANCAQSVRYAGEFHITQHPATGSPMLVVDNNSGTFAPNKDHLPLVAALFRHNFPDIAVDAWDREDPRLVAAIKACPTRS